MGLAGEATSGDTSPGAGVGTRGNGVVIVKNVYHAISIPWLEKKVESYSEVLKENAEVEGQGSRVVPATSARIRNGKYSNDHFESRLHCSWIVSTQNNAARGDIRSNLELAS